MLWTIAVIIFIMWLLGFTFHIAGNLVHLLLLIAIAVVLIRIIQGRNPL